MSDYPLHDVLATIGVILGAGTFVFAVIAVRRIRDVAGAVALIVSRTAEQGPVFPVATGGVKSNDTPLDPHPASEIQEPGSKLANKSIDSRSNFSYGSAPLAGTPTSNVSLLSMSEDQGASNAAEQEALKIAGPLGRELAIRAVRQWAGDSTLPVTAPALERSYLKLQDPDPLRMGPKVLIDVRPLSEFVRIGIEDTERAFLFPNPRSQITPITRELFPSLEEGSNPLKRNPVPVVEIRRRADGLWETTL